jgi:cytochrome P450
MLAMFPEVQQKVFDEIKEVFESEDEPVTFDILNRMTYLECVVKETMRLFPVLPVSARMTTDEVEVCE